MRYAASGDRLYTRQWRQSAPRLAAIARLDESPGGAPGRSRPSRSCRMRCTGGPVRARREARPTLEEQQPTEVTRCVGGSWPSARRAPVVVWLPIEMHAAKSEPLVPGKRDRALPRMIHRCSTLQSHSHGRRSTLQSQRALEKLL